MQAVILAAGKGKRMLPLTLEKPKPLLEVLGKPLIQYTFEALPDVVDEVVVVVGYKHEQIQVHVQHEFCGRRVTYAIEEPLGGTATALLTARPSLSGNFLVYFADDIYLKSDAELLLKHELGFLVAEVSNPERFGVIELDEESRVVSFEEKPAKPKSNLVSAGVLLLDERIFSYEAPLQPDTSERYLTDMVQALARDVPFYGVRATRWIPIGYPEDLSKAEILLRRADLV